jgi:hypothetical protein
MSADLDQGGQLAQRTRVWMGHSLGWIEQFVRPEVFLTTAQTYVMNPGDSIIHVNVAGSVTVQLPDVGAWLNENYRQPVTGYERAIWIKDLGGNAAAFPITVTPFGSQSIDALLGSFTLISNRALLRLYPIYDLTGWFSG